jgi:hypothetical protein
VWDKDRERAFRIYNDEEAKWAKLRQTKVDAQEKIHGQVRCAQEQMAFNIELTRDELVTRLEHDPDFCSKYTLALQRGVSWDEAEKIFVQQTTRQEVLLDQVGQSLTSRFPDPPKPEKMYEQFHKRRKPPGKTAICRQAEGYLRWREAADAINTEDRTPFDK